MTPNHTTSTPYLAKSPEDLIALVPTVLHFEPHESVVLLTFGKRGHSFHARVALPYTSRDQEAISATLLTAMNRNHLRHCAILIYSRDRKVAINQAERFAKACRRAGVQLAVTLLIQGNRYYRLFAGESVATEGTEFDISAHPFTVRRVLDGVVVHSSRAELAQTLAPDPHVDMEAMQTMIQGFLERQSNLETQRHWLLQQLPRQQGVVSTMSDEAMARLLTAIHLPELLDVAWARIDHATVAQQIDFWRDAVRRSPAGYRSAPASLLAFAAWLSGDGAMAWCALDRCAERLPIVTMITRLLDSAVPPMLWPGLSAAELTALRGPVA